MTKVYRDVGISVGMGEYPTNFISAVIDVMTENDIARLLVDFPPRYDTGTEYRKILDIGYTTSSQVYTVESYELTYSDELESYFFLLGRKFTYGERAYIQFRCSFYDGSQQSVDPAILKFKFRPALRIEDFLSYENNDLATQSEILEKLVIQHANVNASTIHTGHVMIDNDTIQIDENGTISVAIGTVGYEEYITSLTGEQSLLINKAVVDTDGFIHAIVAYGTGPDSVSSLLAYYYLTNKKSSTTIKKKIFPTKYSGIWEDDPTYNAYTDRNYIMRYVSGGNVYQEGALLQFDLSSIPDDAEIIKTDLAIQIFDIGLNSSSNLDLVVPQIGEVHLVGVETLSAAIFQTLTISSEVSLPDNYPLEISQGGAIILPWEQTTAYWANAPYYNSPPIATFTEVANGESVEIDITTEVLSMMRGEINNNGWRLKYTHPFIPSGGNYFGVDFDPTTIELIYTQPGIPGISHQPGYQKLIMMGSTDYIAHGWPIYPQTPPEFMRNGYWGTEDEVWIENWSSTDDEGITYFGDLYENMLQFDLSTLPSDVDSIKLGMTCYWSSNVTNREIGLYHIFSGTQLPQESLLQFTIPTEITTVREAKLNITFTNGGVGTENIGIYHINSFWDKDATTWADKPSYTSEPVAIFTASDIDATISVDLFTEISEIASGSSTNNGWYIKYVSDTGTEYSAFEVELEIKYMIGTDWGQYTVTWENIHDYIDDTVLDTFLPMGEYNRPTADMTDISKIWRDNPDLNSGMYIITASDASTDGYGFEIYSGQETFNQLPYLMVEYETGEENTDTVWVMEPIWVDINAAVWSSNRPTVFADISVNSDNIVNITVAVENHDVCFSTIPTPSFTGYLNFRIEGETRTLEEVKRVAFTNLWHDTYFTYSSLDPKTVTTEDGRTYTFMKAPQDANNPNVMKIFVYSKRSD